MSANRHDFITSCFIANFHIDVFPFFFADQSKTKGGFRRENKHFFALPFNGQSTGARANKEGFFNIILVD